MPIKRRRSLVKLPEELIFDEICAKAASRIIVERFYPEDASAFNERSSTSVSSKEFPIGMQALSLAHDTLKQQANKFSDQLQQPYKNLQTSFNFITQQSNQWINQ